MPKISDRRLILSVLEQQMAMAIAIHEDDDLLEDFCDAYVLINNSRYMNTRVRSPRSTEFLLSCALNLNITEFKQNFRCDLESLHRLVELLRPCPVFHNRSRCPQTDVTWQVCIALWRLGHNGNGAATAMQSMLFGFGVGTTVLFTRRVVTALLQVGSEYILWPTEERRIEIGQVMEAEGFPGCVGFVDGTTIPLSEKPAINGECYWDRKHRYSINMQIVCDVDRRIIGFSCGWPGSMHDAGLWRRSVQAKNPNKFFRKGEYIIGDSAYGLSKFLIPAFKSPAADMHMNKEFNYLLAKSRVRNEHNIGILKGRWSCLREHRQQIRSANDVQAIIRVSTACVILHNMLANLGDSWEDMFREVDPVDVSVAENVEGTEMECASAFREVVKSYAIEKGYINGILPIVE
ncbi:hypothetical protein OROHE_002402 [Orobanche hederae]